MKLVIGIGYPVAHDSNIAVVNESGKILFAASEERFSRIKKDGKMPVECFSEIKPMLENNEIFAAIPYYRLDKIFQERYCTKSPGKFKKTSPFWLMSKAPNYILDPLYYGYRLIKSFMPPKEHKNFFGHEVGFYAGHHDSHAASAYYTSGFKKSVIMTYDGGITCEAWLGTIQEGINGEVKRKVLGSRWDRKWKAAWMYSGITNYLGFKPNHHEGKITGLAAFGKHNEKCIEIVGKLLKDRTFSFYYGKRIRSQLDAALGKFSREDIAYAAQRIAEENVVMHLENYMKNFSSENICLAGGLFANVRINQKVKELGFKNIFIHPAMGDDGCGLGSALLYLGKERGLKPFKLQDVYFGTEYDSYFIKKELKRHGVAFQHIKNIEYHLAELLAKEKVIGRFNGRMEYGPRALGNRSILYQATDIAVNDWLNKNLKRTEFMPFAPVTLAEYAKKCYKNLKGAEYAAKFMTITFDCTQWMKESCPAVVHVDNTARPQLIDMSTNPSYYKILDEYRKITGIPSIINTSFNMHEEPIVCSPDDAIRSFKHGKLDYLAIGDFLVSRSQ